VAVRLALYLIDIEFQEAIMKALILGILALFLIQAQAETVSDRVTTSHASSGSYVTSAAEYYEPIKPGEKRDPALLKPLHFESVSVSQKDLEQRLQGQWRIVYHCGGEPMQASAIHKLDGADGYFNPRGEMRFDGTQVTRTDIFPDSQTISKSWQFKLVANGSGWFKIQREKAGTANIHVTRITETGEVVLELKSRLKECSPGQDWKSLLVQMPLLTS
jgi:hypothetical protein